MEETVPRIAALSALTLLSACAGSQISPAELTTIAEPRGCAALVDPGRSTFVFREVQTGRTFACNAPRAARRFTPASTFKIPHALIALEDGVVADEHARLTWDGRPRGVKAWDRDASLAEAVSSSIIWVFQHIATRLGHTREAAAVRRLDYGNSDVGSPGDLRHFWLSGPLAISAAEQVEFLTKLRAGALRADKHSQQRTAAMIRMRGCGPNCVIYGKTGAMLPIDDDGFLREGDASLLPSALERTGWFIGWIERPPEDGGPVVFAHNLDLALPDAMAARTRVPFEILSANGVLKAPLVER